MIQHVDPSRKRTRPFACLLEGQYSLASHVHNRGTLLVVCCSPQCGELPSEDFRETIGQLIPALLEKLVSVSKCGNVVSRHHTNRQNQLSLLTFIFDSANDIRKTGNGGGI